MKLVYPSNGLINVTKIDIKDLRDNLYKAKNNTKYDIPLDFSYLNYLQGLENKINVYLKIVDKIELMIQDIDHSYEALNNQLMSSIEKIEVYDIKERDRLIS